MSILRVGIDDLDLWVPAQVVEATDLDRTRGRGQDLDRLGLHQRGVLDAHEDPVTMAVNAARSLVAETPDIGLLIVATESGFDDAKPISAYVHAHLGLPSTCRHAEVKHACYGATFALRMAEGWVRANPTRTALVVATDVARRLFDDPAEAAEGAGAVAMRVTAEPRFFSFGTHSVVAAEEIFDVRRPTRTTEVIDSARSLAAYLDLLESCWEDFSPLLDCNGAGLDGLVYHAPLVDLVRRAHRMVVGDTVDFETRVAPGLRLAPRIGNTYSASLYVGLLSFATARNTRGTAHIGMYSYGSGSTAELFDGWLHDVEPTACRRIGAQLDARTPVSVPTYERLVLEVERSLSMPDFVPSTPIVEPPPGTLVLDRVVDHHRVYGWS